MDVTTLYNNLASHAMKLGVFETFATHEPKSAPGQGITWAMKLTNFTTVQRLSGLATTALRIEFQQRLYRNMLAGPQDQIDPDLLAAVDVLGKAYSGDFDLDGLIHSIDLLGAYGAPFGGRAGSVMIDGRLYRCIDVTVPVILTDCWDQSGSND